MSENWIVASFFMMMVLALAGVLALVALVSGNVTIGRDVERCSTPAATSTSDASANW